MAEKKQTIHIKLAGKSYPMSIPPEKEEVYRLAEREVNNAIVKYQKVYGDTYSTPDYLALAAFQFSANGITMARQSQINSDDMEALDALSQQLDKHINRMPPQPKQEKK